jgi:hypothetical protein
MSGNKKTLPGLQDSNQFPKLIYRQISLPKYRTQSASIKFDMIWYNDLGERVVAPIYHVATCLSAELKSCPYQSVCTFPPRNPREITHTASKSASKRSSGIGR